VGLPQEEFFEQTADYCAMILDAVNPRPEGVCIHVPWHGQHVMAERIGEFERRLSVHKAHLIADIVVDSLSRLTEQDCEASALRDLVHEGIEGSGGIQQFTIWPATSVTADLSSMAYGQHWDSGPTTPHRRSIRGGRTPALLSAGLWYATRLTSW
jgi:hypothetical protein